MDYQGVTPEEIQALSAYAVEEHSFLPDINSDSYVLRHKKSGARIALLPNADDNKVFFIGFRTPPKDSTGVAHIIEHTVLCGSKEFPVKDPFVEAAKGSLNTFLNAMTYPDRTVYPVASTNAQDFANLMHIYLDAVFHPNIYTDRRIFEQEGWHYEVEPDENGEYRPDGRVVINGVVYNEMKGAMSSPEDVLMEEVHRRLFPDTCYAINSGGDPAVIPDLTYEDYLAFHSRFYHPSNSYIYLYGNADMAERLRWLDENYLSAYDAIPVDSRVRDQERIPEAGDFTVNYSIMEDEEEEGKTWLSMNFAVPVRKDAMEKLAFKCLDFCLCDAEGAPLKEAVRKSGIGEDASSLFETGLSIPSWSVMAKYTEAEEGERFKQVIRDALTAQAESGIEKDALLAAINNFEFHYLEADFGAFPKGLVFGMDILENWIYDDTNVFSSLTIGPLFEELRSRIGTGYFEGILRKYVLDNPHRCLVTMVPDRTFEARTEEALAARIAAFEEGLDDAGRQALARHTKELKEWQETPDLPENLAKIPMLSREDLGKKAKEFCFVPGAVDLPDGSQVKTLMHPLFTGGIDYFDFVFDVTGLPKELSCYTGIFKTLLGVLSTDAHSYAALDQQINIRTGGINTFFTGYSQAKDREQTKMTFEVSCKVLHGNAASAFALVQEILTRTQFTDRERIREVLEEERAALREDLPQSGHSTALARVMSYISRSSVWAEESGGISYYRMIDSICEDFEASFETLREKLEELAVWIFRKERLLFDITAEEAQCREVFGLLPEFAQSLFTEDVPSLHAQGYEPELIRRNEAFIAASPVQYAAQAGNFLRKGYAYTGALRVLRVIFQYEYLWLQIRVKGGAYGCMSGFGKDGTAYFVTYRDPHLKASYDIFAGAPEFLRGFSADDAAMTKYVIGAVSAMDRPMSNSLYGRYSLAGYLSGTSYAEMQKERDEVLHADAASIRALADLVEAALSDGCIACIGGREKIEEHRKMFGSVEALL